MNELASLCCRALSKTYQDGELSVDVIKNVDLTVEKGEQLAIVGASGSGKSTLLHCLGGLELPSKGEVIINGVNTTSLNETARGLLRNKSIGFVYQFHHLLPEFTALENVAMPLLIRNKDAALAREKAATLLEKVGLNHRLKHKPTELSGGERQRAAVARALVNDPQFVLADEPTGNLDRQSAEGIYTLMQQFHDELETSFIIVTHDMSLANRMRRIVTLVDGELKTTMA